eukprot:Tbor_TRINITY_DN6775_c0_g1::TRINITY_DN6775_c0_g1_i1::g.15358::m.15358
MPNLVVSCTFNPPVVTIIGSNLREETIHKLEQRLPTVTSTAASPKRDLAPVFVLHKDPDYWRMDLGQQFCDHLGRSMIYLMIIEALEGEDWKLRATNCMVHHDTQKDTNKFFFTRD